MAEYQRYGVNAHFLRWGWDPKLEDIQHRQEKDLDFYFFGMMSNRRKQIIQSVRQKGLRGAADHSCPYFLRNDRIARAKVQLNEGKPVRQLEFTPEEAKLVKSLGLITAKKVLYVANVAEDDLEGKSPLVERVRERAKIENSFVVPVCGKLESELSELDPADKKEMLDSMGLKEPALAALTREAYKLLGRQSYFTCGPKEIRAWEIPIGATAPEAAGVIHTDFEKKFIRAEVFTIPDLVQHKTEAAIKAAGKKRIEGKDYVMQDGDVVFFLTGA